MTDYAKHAAVSGRIVMIGCGSIGQGVLPLILRHLDVSNEDITIVTADERGHEEARRYDIPFEVHALTRDNYQDVLRPLLNEGDLLVNLSVDVSSVALVRLCHELGVRYVDTCIEPWAGGYTDLSLSPSRRSNYALRESMLDLRRELGEGPTAVVAHGANPGLVSHFVKQALVTIAEETLEGDISIPESRGEWARLAQKAGIKAIHIAERDTQVAQQAKALGEFVNTWSIDGFVGEGLQPAELGWGTHEHALPPDGRRHDFGCDAAIYLMRPGASTRVRTWTPMEGPFHGWLITHNEAISIADYFTARDGGEVSYRPTVHYAYHPCDDAVLSVHELAGKNWHMQPSQRLMMDEISSGVDELGVLLMGHAKGAYWYGSQLSIDEARELAPYNNATSLQVCVAVLSAMVWALRHPDEGIVEADEMDFREHLEVCMPYLGPVVGQYTEWTPLQDRGRLFPEDVAEDDPWQFHNVRVN